MENLTPFIGTLHGVLMHCLASEEASVAVAAARATAAFIQALEDAAQRDQFQVRHAPSLLATSAEVRPAWLLLLLARLKPSSRPLRTRLGKTRCSAQVCYSGRVRCADLCLHFLCTLECRRQPAANQQTRPPISAAQWFHQLHCLQAALC